MKISKSFKTYIHTLIVIFFIGNVKAVTNLNKNIIFYDNPKPIENLKFKDFNLQDVDLSENKGKIMILNFWATWCAPCIKEMPDLIELSNILRKSDYEIIYINQDRSNDIDKIQHYVDKIKLNKNNVFLDPKMKLSKIFKLRGIPTTFIINKSEKVLWRVEGIINWRDERIINWLKKI